MEITGISAHTGRVRDFSPVPHAELFDDIPAPDHVTKLLWESVFFSEAQSHLDHRHLYVQSFR